MTDAEFKRFLRHGGSRVATIVEIEFAYESAGALATGTLCFSDCADPVSGGTKYHDAIIAVPELERSIDLRKLGGRGSRTVGSVTLNNEDGSLDWVLDVIIDGRDAVIAIGKQGNDRSDFRTLGVGVVASVKAANDSQIVIELRDKNYLLDATMIGDVIATGPNTGKPKPILLGAIKNVDITPYLFDTSALKYYINNFALHSTTALAYVFDVRDSGVSLLTTNLFTFSSGTMSVNTGTDVFTYVAHGLAVNDVVVARQILSGALFTGMSSETQYWVKSVPTADTFTLSTTKGGSTLDITGAVMTGTWLMRRQRYYIDAAAATIELSSSPAGRVTIDMQAVDAAGDMANAWNGEVFKYILDNYTKLTPSDYDSSSISAIGGTTKHFGVAVLDRVNVLNVLDLIVAGVSNWYGWKSSGVLTAGGLSVSVLDFATPDDTIDTGRDILSEVTAENMPLQWGKVTLDADRNVVVQNDGIASSVSAENRSLWGQQFQLRVSTTDPGTSGYVDNWWDYHKSAIDSPPIETGRSSIFSSSAGIQSDCDGITDEFHPWTRVHRCTVGLDKYDLDPGDCVTVTYPRYGLSSGKNCRVISVKPRVTERVVDLVLVRQATPDYTTSSH